MAWIAFLFILLPGCASGPLETETELNKRSFSTGQIREPFLLFPEYRIEPGDLLDVLFQLSTWIPTQEFTLAVDDVVAVKFLSVPELNVEQPVRPDRMISLPYLGDVQAAGKTVVQLREDLARSYGKILRNPGLYIVVSQFRSAVKELKQDLNAASRGSNRLVRVRPDGFATFPLLGDIQVAQQTIPGVSKALNDKYEHLVPGLHCDLFLEAHSGTVVYVTGEVNRPGAYEIHRPISVLEAVALAGGHRPYANLDSLVILRKMRDRLLATRVSLAGVTALRPGESVFYLQPDDIVFVPTSWLASTAEVARNVAEILFFRGWSTGISWEVNRRND